MHKMKCILGPIHPGRYATVKPPADKEILCTSLFLNILILRATGLSGPPVPVNLPRPFLKKRNGLWKMITGDY